ncbi:unnamed protein product [Bursaphelenchus xylophilus]|uniref:(pine wood nematode) hypothetical protein n=1 Tax=Bursaphelenchus xylophilus TaxID=6326 RepID=A0A1I7S091_BURXY|nr:unnamed protein product [Bursaphelenchus xylophilus]CAG9108943.1 unnamed protein product [Bursaphelenchus xylophilus]
MEVVTATTMSPMCCTVTLPSLYMVITLFGIYFQTVTIYVYLKDSFYRNNISYRILCIIGIETLLHMLFFLTLIPYGFTCERRRERFIEVTGIISNFSHYINEPLGILLALNRYTEICIPHFKCNRGTKRTYNLLALFVFLLVIPITIWLFTGDDCKIYYFCYRYSVYKDCGKISYIRGRNFMIYSCLFAEIIVYIVIVGHVAAQRTITGEKLRLRAPEKRLLLMSITHFVTALWRHLGQHINNVFFVYEPFSQVSSITVVVMADVVTAILPLMFNKPLLLDVLNIYSAKNSRASDSATTSM